MRILPESRRASAVLLLITVALAACALEFTLHVNSWVQHFVVYWLYNGLVLSAGVVCIARGLASARERAAWISMRFEIHAVRVAHSERDSMSRREITVRVRRLGDDDDVESHAGMTAGERLALPSSSSVHLGDTRSTAMAASAEIPEGVTDLSKNAV